MSEEIPAGVQVKQFRADPGNDPLYKHVERAAAQSPEDAAELVDAAFDSLMAQYEETRDEDIIRQAKLLINKMDEIKERWSEKLEKA